MEVGVLKKKFYAFDTTQQNSKRRRLRDNPAESNELPRLELPWAWEPIGRGRA